MRVFDCFMYYNEDTVLELRLNYLSQFVNYFVIVESTFDHRGQKKKLNFDINKFINFKDKIKYFILDSQPPDIEEIKTNDSENEKSSKYILNGYIIKFVRIEISSKFIFIKTHNRLNSFFCN